MMFGNFRTLLCLRKQFKQRISKDKKPARVLQKAAIHAVISARNFLTVILHKKNYLIYFHCRLVSH